MNPQPFKKFINKRSNAAIKEKYRQEKRAAKKKRAEAIEERKNRKYQKSWQAAPDSIKHKSKPGAKTGSDKPAAIVSKESFPMPLNKYLAHCGIASRRASAGLIKKGFVKVDGEVVDNPAFRITGKEEVVYEGKKLSRTHNLVYILLNKPKDFITTTSDPRNRKTVLNLIRRATDERVYPVGRLDRNTSGVLLLTNDGDLTQKLTHPSYEVEKIYEAKLDKPLTKAHFSHILNGLTMEDGEVHADALAYVDQKDKTVIGIELHSGRNRIVRRIFEHLGYDVRHLDRVVYAGLTKKDVERGKWRYLSDKEVRELKYLKRKSGKTNRKN